ncbi:hypothetical protein B0H11DRAFT_2306468 [Mycena galericulata]|nr:hypothetical protein B0H11DRAFT_2306468 [Mycena galericulata]
MAELGFNSAEFEGNPQDWVALARPSDDLGVMVYLEGKADKKMRIEARRRRWDGSTYRGVSILQERGTIEAALVSFLTIFHYKSVKTHGNRTRPWRDQLFKSELNKMQERGDEKRRNKVCPGRSECTGIPLQNWKGAYPPRNWLTNVPESSLNMGERVRGIPGLDCWRTSWKRQVKVSQWRSELGRGGVKKEKWGHGRVDGAGIVIGMKLSAFEGAASQHRKYLAEWLKLHKCTAKLSLVATVLEGAALLSTVEMEHWILPSSSKQRRPKWRTQVTLKVQRPLEVLDFDGLPTRIEAPSNEERKREDEAILRVLRAVLRGAAARGNATISAKAGPILSTAERAGSTKHVRSSETAALSERGESCNKTPGRHGRLARTCMVVREKTAGVGGNSKEGGEMVECERENHIHADPRRCTRSADV